MRSARRCQPGLDSGGQTGALAGWLPCVAPADSPWVELPPPQAVAARTIKARGKSRAARDIASNDRKRRPARPRLAAGQLCERRAKTRGDMQELAADEDRVDAGPLERDDLFAIDRPARPSDDELSRGDVG
jgi:hypothetical protein